MYVANYAMYVANREPECTPQTPTVGIKNRTIPVLILGFRERKARLCNRRYARVLVVNNDNVQCVFICCILSVKPYTIQKTTIMIFIVFVFFLYILNYTLLFIVDTHTHTHTYELCYLCYTEIHGPYTYILYISRIVYVLKVSC